MTGLCGWFDPHYDSNTLRIEERAACLPGSVNASSNAAYTTHGAGLVRGGWLAQDDAGRIALISGHPRWRDAELATLAQQGNPAQALLESYRRHAEGLLTRIGGDFVLTVIDPLASRVLVAIDRMGQFPLHYAQIPGGLVFGSSATSVLAHPALQRRITPNGLYHYLFFHMLPAPVSLFAGLSKLQAAHYIDGRFGSHAQTIQIEPYWTPEFTESESTPLPELGEQLQHFIGDSVQRLAQVERPGAFLSGGLDSSTVAGYLAQARPEAADTFSIGFEAEGYDELPYARIAAQHFNTRAHEYYVTPDDVVTAVPLIAAGYDEPFGNSSALPAYFCARLAADHGITRLLAGDGGDELFAGNARYAKQPVFEHWQRIPQTVREGVLQPLLTRLPRGMLLLGKARSYVEQARIPLPDRLQSYNHLHRLALDELFEAEFLAQIEHDAPWALMRELYQRPAQASTLNRMMVLDWQQTLADNDLRKVSRMCQLAGVDVVYPMLDDDLVEFSCRVPSALKLPSGRLRHFYKQAMRDFLPPAIIDKKKHGFGLPFGVWMQDHAPLRELAYDGLLRFKQRGIMQAGFIDRLITLHREGHAAYYGELVWVLMMLDLWLESHETAV